MGAKDSKPSFITYEDAVKRVSDSELRRIREAFKRCAGANGTALSLEAFVHEVLCDGVPFDVAEWLYQACGGTKRGIAFKELLCGIVVLTKGNLDEKIKFLWTLYVNNQGDNGTYIYQKEFARALHLENSSLADTTAQRSADILLGLFGTGDKATFDQFRSWLLIHKDATVLSKWLLYEVNDVYDLETPTFYQSLAGVTHLEERDIIELEKCFWALRGGAGSGQLDAGSVRALVSPPLPAAAAPGAFLAFDENRDGHVDFKELCCGLSAACRGPTTERLKFCFKIFDLDSDGVLNRKELVDMVDILCTVANDNMKQQHEGSRASTPSLSSAAPSPDAGGAFEPAAVLADLVNKLDVAPHNGRKPNFHLGPHHDHKHTAGCQGGTEWEVSATLEDFLIWSVESAEAVVTPFLDLIYQVCHIVLGLRPQCRRSERDIVLGWLRRSVASGYSVGQFWYLISAEWWSAWLWYTGEGAGGGAGGSAGGGAGTGEESGVSTSSESLGSLLWRGDSASVISTASSAAPRRHPGPIRNKRLLADNTHKVRTLTGEGGHLRRDVTLAQHRDFELVPDALWRALALWYGGPDPLPRQVIRPPNSDVELELYPLQLNIMRHVPQPQRSVGSVPERQLAYTAAFSRLATIRQVCEFICGALGLAREDMRLWLLGGGAGGGPGGAGAGQGGGVLLDDEQRMLHELQLDQRSLLLLELRNKDLTWPEEIGALSTNRATERRETLIAPDLPGATGLHNLGNTCFMNAALQSVWNTGPLTRYFNSGMHLYEVNTSNPLGTKGVLAMRYGELCKEVWSCSARSVAPLGVRWCVSRHARALAGGGQHDAQELLAWLLDALHEDLNRASRGPAPPPPADSAGRPDQAVAAEAWAAHAARNRSVITDLFYGQLKSKVRCDACHHESVRFDVFNMLSLPLPMESYLRLDVRVILLDGSVPVKYGVRVNSEGTYLDFKKKLSELCGLDPELMLVVELCGGAISRVLRDGARVSAARGDLVAYQLPPAGAAPAPTEAAPAPAAPAPRAGTPPAPRRRQEVSVGASDPASLCMPALFCFKRSRSSLEGGHPRAPRAMTRGSSSPALSGKPTSPRLALAKVKFGSSPSNMCAMSEPADAPLLHATTHYLIAVHRKQCRADAYFMGWGRSRPAVFGVPLVVAVHDGMTGRQLHAALWTQLARLLSARPPAADLNHATDCDDSLGYEFPFSVRAVRAGDGAWCALCAWPALCRGCLLPNDDTPLLLHAAPAAAAPAAEDVSEGEEARADGEDSSVDSGALCMEARPHGEGVARRVPLGAVELMLAVDWEPTALHLRYSSAHERALLEHASVRGGEARPASLASCLRSFTRPERLEQRYHCARCRALQPATKTLQIWRLPPILVIHLKRFQYVNDKWIKSQKVVNFPFHEFDPTEFLAAVPQETILRHREQHAPPDPAARSDDSDTDDNTHVNARRRRLQSTSLASTPVTADNLEDYHRHHLLPNNDPLDLHYTLYAVVCHSGQLSGGHYVAYARNPSGAWLCYNDSMCRALPSSPPPIDPAAAYLLFYERRGLDYDRYLPDVSRLPPAAAPPAPSPALALRANTCALT